ncbi:hypothetical protein CL618_02195 [archaeon]|nr:hypothetical protein [archaeon]|tara:strand:- start:3597 stop:5093 length:1497 start_codon:yes stop_codon:yes gene_type:complete
MKNWKLLIIFVIALVLRIILVGLHKVIEEDGIIFAEVGKNFILGNGFLDIEGRIVSVITPFYSILIGFLYLILKNAELSGRVIAALFGSLLIFPVYLLGKEIYNKKVGLISAFLIAIYPVLIFLSSIVYADSLYYFLVMFGAYFGFIALKKENKWLFFLTGILFALSYLTRVEGGGYLVIILGFIISKKNWKKILKYGLFLFLGFLIISLPYFVFVHGITGKWQTNAKSTLVFQFGKAETYSEEYERNLFELVSDDKIRRDVYMEQYESVLKPILENPLNFLKNYFKNLYIENNDLVKIFPLVLFLIMFFGIFKSENLFKQSYLAMFVLYPLLLYPVFFILTRYLVVMVPVFLIWLGKGLDEFGKISKKLGYFLILFVVLFSLTGIVMSISHEDYGVSKEAIEHKEMGEWLKGNGYGEKIVMGRKAWVAYYSDSKQVYLPYDNYNEIKKYGCLNDVDLVVLDERFIRTRPMLEEMLDMKDYLYKIEEPFRIIVFELNC